MNDMVAKQVGKMKRGDESAFDWLYSEYVGKLYRMAFFITGNQADSEDIMQETFVKCYLRKDSIRDEQAFEAWLYQILVRTAWRYQKSKQSDFSLDYLFLLADVEPSEEDQKRLEEEGINYLLFTIKDGYR